MSKVFISTVPFADKNTLPIELLQSSGIDFLINPLNRKLNEEELIKLIDDLRNIWI